MPEWYIRGAQWQPTAFVASTGAFIDISPRRTTGAFGVVDRMLVESWCEHAAQWTARSVGEIYLGLTLQVNGMATAACLRPGRDGGSRVSLGPRGQMTFQVYDPDASLVDQAQTLRAALLADPVRTQLGFVAAIRGQAGLWDDREKAMPPLPTIPASALRNRPDLWNQFVPDAHAMQLLTGEHMRRVADLSAWNVTDVGHGRFLVEAADLHQWLRPGGPDQAVIDRARADFGRAIVPAEALADR